MKLKTVNIMNHKLEDEILMREMLDDDGPLGTDGVADDAAVDAALRAVRRKLARTLGRARRPLARIGVIGSPVGRLLVAESARGLLAVQFLDVPEAPDAMAALREAFDLVEDPEAAARVGDEIERYLKGDMHALDRPVDLSLVRTDFQRRALMRLRRAVPPGSVITYQGLAAAVGAPSSQRAIGNTMATNPVPLYVPCHRVIRSDGTIGNYGGGVARKVRLLRAEGFSVNRDHRLPAGSVMGHLVTHIFCRPRCHAAMRADRAKSVIFANSGRARGAGLRACKLCRPA
ncbi:MAG TPA: methylated-DNA--[protein]-cysteine S-methyltransferase [Candidatus Binataceae bacterium]|nr:methylated-DNA--[protein]-cysteine S-methyltransferase [Candidatus Binataceae bacterium]